MDQKLIELNEKAKTEPNNPDFYKELGNHFFHLQKYEEAIGYYQKSLDIDPRYYKGFYNLGNTYYKLEQHEKAVHYWHMAIEIKPDFDHAFFNLGYHYHQRGFLREAIRDLCEAARLNPNAADTHYYLGKCYFSTNQLGMAIESFRRAIKLAPDDPEYHYDLANADYDNGDFQGAADEWSVNLGLRTKDSKARNNYCDALLKLGRPEDALSEIAQVLNEDPVYPPALCTKAEILEKVGRSEESKKLFQEALALIRGKENWEPLQRYIMDNLRNSRYQGIEALLNGGLAKESLVEVEKFLAEDSEFLPAMELKARIFEKLGQPEDAVEVLNRVKTLREMAEKSQPNSDKPPHGRE